MSKLIIKNQKDFIELKGREIINLEVKLNITEHGNQWKHIGDHLYKFYTLEGYEGQPMNILDVTEYQFNYLKDLNRILSDISKKGYVKINQYYLAEEIESINKLVIRILDENVNNLPDKNYIERDTG